MPVLVLLVILEQNLEQPRRRVGTESDLKIAMDFRKYHWGEGVSIRIYDYHYLFPCIFTSKNPHSGQFIEIIGCYYPPLPPFLPRSRGVEEPSWS